MPRGHVALKAQRRQNFPIKSLRPAILRPRFTAVKGAWDAPASTGATGVSAQRRPAASGPAPRLAVYYMVMRADLFDYELPPELIAQTPAPARSDSRLLVLDRAGPEPADHCFAGVGQFLRAPDCLVLNDTKVLAARFFAERTSGASLEGLFLAAHTGAPSVWQVLLKGARKVRPGERILIMDRRGQRHCEAELLDRHPDGTCLLRMETERDAEAMLDDVGFPPLPPYIRRDGDIEQAREDRRRYQTVYARRPGAVAAPTAGLHFTEPLLARLREQGVRLATLTLHVGPGTFKPVTTAELEDHAMHSEWYELDAENARTINAARADGGRIVAVGTTATRVLETVASGSGVCPGQGTTDLFIMPGYTFRAVDALITNFHLPRSTLLALVAAFAGLDRTLAAYRHAVARRYRFYSYGDAMLIM